MLMVGACVAIFVYGLLSSTGGGRSSGEGNLKLLSEKVT